jgi:hypothetical protein
VKPRHGIARGQVAYPTNIHSVRLTWFFYTGGGGGSGQVSTKNPLELSLGVGVGGGRKKERKREKDEGRIIENNRDNATL